MSIVLVGSTSGSITLQEPAVAGTTVLDLPATTGNVVVDGATQTLTNKTLTSPTFGGTPTGVGVLTSGTSASASSTSVDFTSIPSWVKRITVMFDGVSTNGSSQILIQIGDSGGIENTGYGSSGAYTGTAASGSTNTTGFLAVFDNGAGTFVGGSYVLCLLANNTWVLTGNYCYDTTSPSNFVGLSAGTKTLSATLDRVRITTASGTQTFDAGTINILYE